MYIGDLKFQAGIELFVSQIKVSYTLKTGLTKYTIIMSPVGR